MPAARVTAPCTGCVLRVMGSMPEGRKCDACIGAPVVDPRHRAWLGRGSRLLARVLAPEELRQVMRAERGCAANQVRPDEVVVNGRGLSQGELDLLLGCAVPPDHLVPGQYWYDKDSGLWGKVQQPRTSSCKLVLLVPFCCKIGNLGMKFMLYNVTTATYG